MAVPLDVLMAAISPAVNDAWRSHPDGRWHVREVGDEHGCIALLRDSTGRSTRLEPSDAGAGSITAMAAAVQDLMTREREGELWPPCPDHAGHPLHPQVAGGAAVWACPDTDTPVARIGALVDDETAAVLQADADARAVAWIADYQGLTREQAEQRASSEGRPVRLLGPDGGRRPDLVPSRLNLHLGPDGRLLRVSAG